MVVELYKGDRRVFVGTREDALLPWKSLYERGANLVAYDSEGNKYNYEELLNVKDVETAGDDILYTTED